MGYAEARLQREVQQLKRDAQMARNRERQTRQGCMDLVQALREIVASLAGSGAITPARAAELVEHAGVFLAPDSDLE